MPFHVSFAFDMRARRNAGWSENFWHSAGTLPTALEAAEKLRKLLVPIHGTQTVLSALTVRDAANNRVAKNIIYEPNQLDPSVAGDSDYPTTSLLLKLTDNSGDYYTKQWIKGIPDDITLKGFYKPGELQKKIEAVLKHLGSEGNGWQLRVTDKANVWKQVQGCSNAGVVTITAHGYANNDVIRISKIGGVGPINGLWKIMNVTADTFFPVGFQALAAPAGWDGKGRCKKSVMTFKQCKLVEVLGISKRNVGRPSNQLSGRRRTRRT